MKRIASLKQALLAALPELQASPDRLGVFVDKGRLVPRYGPSLAWEYRYQTRLWLESFQGSADRVMLPLLMWLRTNQPDLVLSFANDDNRIAFVADILSEDATDILIEFDLTEAVAVTPRADGSGWDLEHLPEPSPDDMLLDGAVAEVPLAEIWIGNERVIPLPDA